MELEDHNCWTIAEALGHSGPHRLQHLLSRAVWEGQQVLERAAARAAGRLDDGEAVLMVDETADAKSSCDAAGAACQDSGTLGGIALRQVAVTLTLASGRGHALIDRALYLPPACAADDEHRELAGIPDEVSFATKPELADELNIIRFGNSQAVADGGLAWSADGSQLFAVLEYFDVNTGTFTFSLQVIDQPTLTR